MSETVDQVLQRLHEEGVDHDAITHDRSKKMLNITPDTGEFLADLIAQKKPTRILELGTSNGYSTIWLARAAQQADASLTTVEYLPSKVGAAVKNINDASLGKVVDLRMLNIGKFLSAAKDNSFDFIFLDADRTHYRHWLSELTRVCDWGTLVVDNATDHEEELQSFVEAITGDSELQHDVAPIGKGQLVVTATL